MVYLVFIAGTLGNLYGDFDAHTAHVLKNQKGFGFPTILALSTLGGNVGIDWKEMAWQVQSGGRRLSSWQL